MSESSELSKSPRPESIMGRLGHSCKRVLWFSRPLVLIAVLAALLVAVVMVMFIFATTDVVRLIAALPSAFIGKIDTAENLVTARCLLVMRDLDDLKDCLTKTAPMIMAMLFLECALRLQPRGLLDLLHLGAGVVLNLAIGVPGTRENPAGQGRPRRQRLIR